ncbi:MAG: lysyl oxidase family protein [Actinomycetota bacterium]|nr:lysyl oxidase family protein [Actinomycetota bacterium]
MKRFSTIVVLSSILSALGLATAHAYTAGQLHYPDLRPLRASELRISYEGGKKLLRFSTIVVNVGDGRLQLRPESNASTKVTKAIQEVFSHDSSGRWYLALSKDIGTFTFHPEHNHWHFEKFARYELRNDVNGAMGSEIKRVSEKTTFCIIDTYDYRSAVSLAHEGSRTYTSCGQNDTTGITVGWGDKYGYHLSGQSIDVTSLPNGYYWVRIVADYGGKIIETNDSNNASSRRIYISGSSVYW